MGRAVLARIASRRHGLARRAVALAVLTLAAGHAMGQARPTARDLVETPRALIGQAVRLDRMRCYDPGVGDYICERRIGNRLLRVIGEASPFISVAAIQAFVAHCGNAAALVKPACDMRVSGIIESATVTGEAMPSGTVDLTTVRLRGMQLDRP